MCNNVLRTGGHRSAGTQVSDSNRGRGELGGLTDPKTDAPRGCDIYTLNIMCSRGREQLDRRRTAGILASEPH